MSVNIPAIELHHVDYAVRNEEILQDIHCTIAPGDFVGIFGPNGGGKTTLLRLIMGFIHPTKGSLHVFGKSPQKVRHRIGYVPQTHLIDRDFPITVKELIGMGLLSHRPLTGRWSADDWKKCTFWMEKLGLIDHKNKAYSELSGGLAQRALLARALVADPHILILDEPTAHIDAASLAIFLDVLDQLQGHKTILLVTHDLKIIAHRANRLLCLQNSLSLFLPHEICEHFNLGLYHAPVCARSPQ